jgi:hypothetical protein
MNRRKLLQYGALGSASLLANMGLLNQKKTNAFSSESMNKKQIYDWIFLYWMPYDNNLSHFGKPILQMITKGVQTENILVAVQSDFSGAKHLSRNIITKGNVDIQDLETADSSSEKVFAEYLAWAREQFQAKKWAIVFLGHGGCLDQISPDEHPELGFSSKTKWMNIKNLSDIITNFNREVDERVELVFFQNCNKGTIEAHYTFRDTAKYTLSSQLLLGAPNYYYEQLFQFIGMHPEINGGQLADKIVEFEPSNMYHSYTVINNLGFRSLPQKINPLLESIISSNVKRIESSELETYSYMDERFVDVVSLLEKITKQADATQQQKYNEFVNFFNTSLVYSFKQDGTLLNPSQRRKKLCGLGLFLPRSKNELDKYRYLQVFSDLKFVELFDAIVFNS